MAVFLLRAEHGASYVPPPATGIFGDLIVTDPFTPWIEELVLEGVTAGLRRRELLPEQPEHARPDGSVPRPGVRPLVAIITRAQGRPPQ